MNTDHQDHDPLDSTAGDHGITAQQHQEDHKESVENHGTTEVHSDRENVHQSMMNTTSDSASEVCFIVRGSNKE